VSAFAFSALVAVAQCGDEEVPGCSTERAAIILLVVVALVVAVTIAWWVWLRWDRGPVAWFVRRRRR
jgi:hypothetical protein